jgi:hypothetical protein
MGIALTIEGDYNLVHMKILDYNAGQQSFAQNWNIREQRQFKIKRDI